MNRLRYSVSSYLQECAHQPVHWFEHTEGAFEEAKRLKKPIFININASWSHLCHVMDKEHFQDKSIAHLINTYFIPIKIDRDQSLDLDTYYQNIVAHRAGLSGWPLNIFLTEKGHPFFGGSYYPREDEQGIIGFKTLLAQIKNTYTQKGKQLLKEATKITAHIQNLVNPKIIKKQSLPASKAHARFLQRLFSCFDKQYGGFSRTPKFPSYTILDHLVSILKEQTVAVGNQKEMLHKMLTTTLTAMARGGIYDHLGDGFHRYASDQKWHLPQREKILADNAMLLKNYLDAYKLTSDEKYKHIAEGITRYACEELYDKVQGGFYGSQNTDESYYTCETHEMRKILTKEETDITERYFDIDAMTKNILKITTSIQEIAKEKDRDEAEIKKLLVSAINKLRRARMQREKPKFDKTLYTGCSALMIKSMLKTCHILKRKKYQMIALKTLKRVLASTIDKNSGCFFHTPSSKSVFLEDNVYLLDTLVEAYKSTGDTFYLKHTFSLLENTARTFWNKKMQLYHQNSAHSKIPVYFPIVDQPLPAANPLMSLIFIELSVLFPENRTCYHKQAETVLKSCTETALRSGIHAATFWTAWYVFTKQRNK